MKKKKNAYLLFHPSSLIPPGGGMLSVALSLSLGRPSPRRTDGFQTVGITHHRVLWSPDFPLPGSSPGSDRPAGPRIMFILADGAATCAPFWTSTAELRIMIESNRTGHVRADI